MYDRLSDHDVRRVASEVVRQLRRVDQLEFLRPQQIQQILGVSKSYFYKILRGDRRAGGRPFPKPVTLPGGKVRVWKRKDVEEWMLTEMPSDD